MNTQVMRRMPEIMDMYKLDELTTMATLKGNIKSLFYENAQFTKPEVRCDVLPPRSHSRDTDHAANAPSPYGSRRTFADGQYSHSQGEGGANGESLACACVRVHLRQPSLAQVPSRLTHPFLPSPPAHHEDAQAEAPPHHKVRRAARPL